MKLGKQIFLALVLILSAIISGRTDKGIFHGDANLQNLSRQDFLRSSCSLVSVFKGIQPVVSAVLNERSFYAQGRAASGQSGTRVEKHHQRTIASEAIIADFSFSPPPFSYCSRNYSLFLQGGCAKLSSSVHFLRGPPFCC
jgi:hypothetical protein